MTGNQRIVVGIDFGTTYSGAAWALQTSPNDVEVISEWPGGGNRTTPKVPTTISYGQNKILWGHETRALGEVIRGMKLLLDPTQEIKYTPALESKQMLEKYDKEPVDVARDYLQLLVARTKEVLIRRFGKAMESMATDYVLTVPAVWTDRAKNLTLTAASDAGIPATNLTLVSEPEAAALYCLKAIQPNTIEDGDIVLICDAGGGTVDLISYCVKSVQPLELEEATTGTGSICGSVLLDQRFEEHMVGVLGEQKYHGLSPKSREMAMKFWEENIKPHFAGISDEDEDEDGYSNVDYFVPLVGVGDKRAIGLESGFLTISQQSAGKIFKPVIDQIIALVQEQMLQVSLTGKKVKAILLVGGFGSSEYLFKRLRSAVINVTVMQPPNAWSAVVRGAVLRGLEGNQVNIRIARRHYGVACSAEYDPKSHDSAEKYWDDLNEKWYVDERLQWYLEKGEKISENEPIKMSWFITVPKKQAEQKLKCLQDDLYICNNDDAPDHITKDIHKVCSLVTDLSAVPQSLFKLRTNSKGQQYYDVDYDIAMTPTSASILFNVEIKGVSYGLVHAQY